MTRYKYGSSPREWGTQARHNWCTCSIRFIPTRVGNTDGWTKCTRSRTVHPHASGEHTHRRAQTTPNTGSSPREWGTHLENLRCFPVMRFIPTRVGNTAAAGLAPLVSTVHPHASGEHVIVLPSAWIGFGSSPREWGTHGIRRRTPAHRRFIPTRVGNTSTLPLRKPRNSVHPHASGEHHHHTPTSSASFGSSPREWGTRRASSPFAVLCRFIPTRVGNTPGSQAMPQLRPVHPHASGEHSRLAASSFSFAGSSPREWGTLFRPPSKPTKRRFIPTRVGNTGIAIARRGETTVHPHASGEHMPKQAAQYRRRGSSPREWGTPACTPTRTADGRFIPTRVGNTLIQKAVLAKQPVHPHASGEHSKHQQQATHGTGSSPREWGTRHQRSDRSSGRRFIPTRVGNTS